MTNKNTANDSVLERQKQLFDAYLEILLINAELRGRTHIPKELDYYKKKLEEGRRSFWDFVFEDIIKPLTKSQ